MTAGSPLQVSTPLGAVEGLARDGYQRFAGIRYGKAPAGPLRFRAPQPVDSWDGVYDAKGFGANAMQPAAVGVLAGGRSRKIVCSSTCTRRAPTTGADR